MNWLPPYSSAVWKAIIGVVAGMVLLGAVLFGIDRCGHYWSDKKADKLKANVNLAINAIQQAQANKANSDIDIAVKVEQLKQATNAALEATNATEQARVATNATLANLAKAVNANKPVETTAEDLQRRLDELNK